MHNYMQHFVVAEEEWTIMGDGVPRKYTFAGLEWECVFKQRGAGGHHPYYSSGGSGGGKTRGNSVKLECKDVASGKRSEVELEVILSDRNYEPLDKQYPKHRMLNAASPSWELSLYKSAKRSAAAANATAIGSATNLLNGYSQVVDSLIDLEMEMSQQQQQEEEDAYYDDMDYMMGGSGQPQNYDDGWGPAGGAHWGGRGRHAYHSHIFLTIRILEKRAALPNFLQPNLQIGHLECNGTVQLGLQTFFVNKELLSIHSPVFHRLFKKSPDGKVVLPLPADTPEHLRFYDFLLCMSLPGHKALPNPKSVADLLKLAKTYQADQVREECERHLKLCHEMPLEKRILLAKQFGLKELQLRIVQEMASPERCQILCQKLWDLLNNTSGGGQQ